MQIDIQGRNLAASNQVYIRVPYDPASHLLNIHSNKFLYGPVGGHVWGYLL